LCIEEVLLNKRRKISWVTTYDRKESREIMSMPRDRFFEL